MRRDERGKTAAGCAPALVYSVLRFAPDPLRCSVSWPAEKLASLTAFAALEQSRESDERGARCARAATTPALLSAAQCRCRRTPGHGFASTTVVFVGEHNERRAGPGAVPRWGESGPARSAVERGEVRRRRRRTGEEPLSCGAFSAATAVPQPPSRNEHRSAPRLQGGAAQSEPRRGTALGPR